MKDPCLGCEDDFYNGKNPLGVKKCWHRESARMTLRMKVGVDDSPPWTWKPKRYLSCYRQKRYVFINCENGDRQSYAL